MRPEEINVEKLGHDKVDTGAEFVHLFIDKVTTGRTAENQIFIFYVCILNAEKERVLH